MEKLSKPIYISKPVLLPQDIQNVKDVLNSGNLVQGKKVLELENKFSDYLGASNCSALSNGTSTLHLSLLALDLKENDEVIVPAFSYIASANVIEIVKAKPVFVDIDINTFNIDISKIEASISNKTKALMIVHEFGLPAEMDEIIFLAKKYNLPVIEDAACAIGSKYKGQHVGTIGDFGSFSLHPRKIITSGEGGIITCKEEYYESFFKIIRSHGAHYNEKGLDFPLAGFNYRLTDFQAALVLDQLGRIENIISERNNIADLYLKKLDQEKYILPTTLDYCRNNWQTFHVLVNDQLDRGDLIKYLADNNIFINYGAQCIPEMEYYKKKYNLNSKLLFPNSYKSFTKGLALPMCEAYSLHEIDQIIYILNNYK